MTNLPAMRNPLQLCECGCDLDSHKHYGSDVAAPRSLGRCTSTRCSGKNVGEFDWKPCDSFAPARELMIEIVVRDGVPVVIDRDGNVVSVGDVIRSPSGEVSLRLSATDVVFGTMDKRDRERRGQL